jgi:hypothetical protein
MSRVKLRCPLCGEWVDLDKDEWKYNKDHDGIIHEKCEEKE